MAIQHTRAGATRAVPGKDWIQAGREGQGEFWEYLRSKWHEDLRKGGWQLCEAPQETVEYDEERGLVMLHIRGLASREDYASPIDYGARGGQPFGYA